MKAMFIPIVIGALNTATKEYAERLEVTKMTVGEATIQITVLLRSVRIQKRLQEIEESFCHSNVTERPPDHRLTLM